MRSCPHCPLPAWVLEYREVSKLRTAFLEPYEGTVALTLTLTLTLTLSMGGW